MYKKPRTHNKSQQWTFLHDRSTRQLSLKRGHSFLLSLCKPLYPSLPADLGPQLLWINPTQLLPHSPAAG